MAVDPFTVYTGLQIAGSVLGFLGQRKADEAQAEAERANAAFFEEQAKLAEFETARELDIFERESEFVIGAQVSALSRSGIAFVGSAVSSIALSKSLAAQEKAAIKKAGESRVKLARLRASEASTTADALSNRGGMQLLSAGIGLGSNLLTGKRILGKTTRTDSDFASVSPTYSNLEARGLTLGQRRSLLEA